MLPLRTILAVPLVDGIHWNSMSFYAMYGGTHHRGIFEWGFLYKEKEVPKKILRKRKHRSEPYPYVNFLFDFSHFSFFYLMVALFTLRTILAVPIVDGINWDSMAYYPVYDDHHHRGIFEWGFLYKEGLVPKKVLDLREQASQPYAYVE